MRNEWRQVVAYVRVIPSIVVLLDSLEPAHIVVRMGYDVNIQNVLVVLCSEFGSDKLPTVLS